MSNQTYADDDHESPDCRVGKHVACSGDAWCLIDDKLSPCLCDCHNA